MTIRHFTVPASPAPPSRSKIPTTPKILRKNKKFQTSKKYAATAHSKCGAAGVQQRPCRQPPCPPACLGCSAGAAAVAAHLAAGSTHQAHLQQQQQQHTIGATQPACGSGWVVGRHHHGHHHGHHATHEGPIPVAKSPSAIVRGHSKVGGSDESEDFSSHPHNRCRSLGLPQNWQYDQF